MGEPWSEVAELRSVNDRLEGANRDLLAQVRRFEDRLTAAQQENERLEDKLKVAETLDMTATAKQWEGAFYAEKRRAETAEAERDEAIKERDLSDGLLQLSKRINRHAIEQEFAAKAQAEQLRAERDRLREREAKLREKKRQAYYRAEIAEAVLRRVAVDLRRRLAGDDAIDAPFDEDLSEALQAIEALTSNTATPEPQDG